VVAADFVSNQGLTQRVAFLRGKNIDIAVEQRNADMEKPEPWDALNMAIRTVVSAANQPQSGDRSPVEFNKTVEAANKAFEKKDYNRVVEALNDAIHIGTSAWLSSMAAPSGSPEINAAVRVAQAMVHLGRFTGDPFLTRDAASILRRSLCSLEAAGKATVEAAQGLVAELKEVLDSIESELLENADQGVSQYSAPIISIRERGFRLTQAGTMAFEAADFKSASGYAEAAVEDFLFLLAYFRRGRSQQIPDEILKHLVDQGIDDHEEQRDAIQKAREGVLFPALNLSLQIRYCCAMEKKDPDSASEATKLLIPLARQIADYMPGDTSIELNLAIALMDATGVIAIKREKEKLRDGVKYLEEAALILDATGDKTCKDDGWVRTHEQQVDKSLQALTQWLVEVEKNGGSDLKAGLQSLLSNFEAAAGRLKAKITKSEKTTTSETNAPATDEE
jgi:hypothetical protein